MPAPRSKELDEYVPLSNVLVLKRWLVVFLSFFATCQYLINIFGRQLDHTPLDLHHAHHGHHRRQHARNLEHLWS